MLAPSSPEPLVVDVVDQEGRHRRELNRIIGRREMSSVQRSRAGKERAEAGSAAAADMQEQPARHSADRVGKRRRLTMTAGVHGDAPPLNGVLPGLLLLQVN